MKTTRRTLMKGVGLATGALGLSLASTSTAHAVTSKWKHEPIGGIPGSVDLDYGVAGTWSPRVSAPILITYSEGLGSTVSVTNALTGELLPIRQWDKNETTTAYGPLTQSYDRFEQTLTYKNRQSVFMTTMGWLVHVNPNDLTVKAYRPAGIVKGQLGTMSEGSTTYPAGLEKTYVSDFDGNFGRFILPAGMNKGNVQWYNFGRPLGNVPITATGFMNGWVYLGTRGKNGGLYRVRETTLDSLVASGSKLTADKLERLKILDSIFDQNNIWTLQLIPMAARKSMIARLEGGYAVELDLSTDQPRVKGPKFRLNQVANTDSTGSRLFTRVGHNNTQYAFEMDLSRPAESWVMPNTRFVGNLGKGSLVRGVPAIQHGSDLYLVNHWQENAKITKVEAPVNHWKGLVESTVVATGVTANLTQLNIIKYLPQTDQVVFAPKWVNDVRYGVIQDRLSANPQIEVKTFPMDKRGSTQVETLSELDGKLFYGTYPMSGIGSINHDGSQAMSKVWAQDVDGQSARPTVSATTAHNGVLIGTIGAYNQGKGGSVVTVGRNGQFTTRTVQSMIGSPQNITAIEYMPVNGANMVFMGTNSRLEDSTQYADKEPDATVIYSRFYPKGSLGSPGYLTSIRTVKLPQGVKSVWALKYHEGTLYALVQFGNMKTPDRNGNMVADANRLLTLDPVAGTVTNGIGEYIYTTTRNFANRGDIVSFKGRLVVRANVFLYDVAVRNGKIESIADIHSAYTAKPINAVSLTTDGHYIYYTYFDGKVHRMMV